jgi:hypothetical protein
MLDHAILSHISLRLNWFSVLFPCAWVWGGGFVSTRVCTQLPQLEPLHQPLFCDGFFKPGVGLKPWSFWCLLSSEDYRRELPLPSRFSILNVWVELIEFFISDFVFFHSSFTGFFSPLTCFLLLLLAFYLLYLLIRLLIKKWVQGWENSSVNACLMCIKPRIQCPALP